jgi:hypothetical protein
MSSHLLSIINLTLALINFSRLALDMYTLKDAFLDNISRRNTAARGLIGLVSLVLVYGFGQILYYRLFHPLARFPGPFFASFTNFWKVYQVASGRYEDALLDLHRKYGKLVRIGPNHLDVSDASAVKSIYGGGRHLKKRYVSLDC